MLASRGARRSWIALVFSLTACHGSPVEPGLLSTDSRSVPTSPKLIPPIIGGSNTTRQQVIRFFAPVIYQDIEDHSEADLLTRVTFDGNWRGTDNWENTFLYPKRGYVYTSLIEDANRYFLHYGLYWPRDWCSFTCTFGQDYHENDMEGLSLVIDKRFIAPGWPYGQVITMDTRSHNGISRFRNCAPAGGYPVYVTLRNSGSIGCILFKPGYNATVPSPPSRAAVFANAQSHAVRAFVASDYPFAGGDGVVYFPTDGPPQVPASTSAITQAGYNIQWMDSSEVNAWSLWGQRRNPIVGYESLFEYDGGLVGPHDVYYHKHVGCNNNCPTLFSTRAKAPWGIAAAGSERVGDWHNHPAYAWARQYAPVAAYSSYFEYTCLAETCRGQNRYVHNIYWDDAPWAAGSGSGGGGTPCTGCPKTTAGLQVQGKGAEQRWDFDGLQGVSLLGDAKLSIVQQSDDEWGYAGGTFNSLRIQGQGQVSLIFDGPFDPQRLDMAVVRARRGQGRPASITARWESDQPGEPSADQQAIMAQEYITDRNWQMLKLDLTQTAGWKRLNKVKQFILTFGLDGGPADAVDLDFVILTP
jgi:hypothetical protein